jgi:hypothetical protein
MNVRDVDSLTAYHDTFSGFDSWQKKLLFVLTYRYVPDSISHNLLFTLLRPFPHLKTYQCPNCGYFENNLYPYTTKKGVRPSRKSIVTFFLVVLIGIVLLLLLSAQIKQYWQSINIGILSYVSPINRSIIRPARPLSPRRSVTARWTRITYGFLLKYNRMRKSLSTNYKKFSSLKRKQSVLSRFFHAFLPEAVYRNTKIEHPHVSKKTVSAFLK